MADHVVYTGFDPEFGDRLNRLISLAKAQGYAPDLISGRRDAYGWPGMKGQSQAELYSQLGKPGGPKAAAPPGYSPHQYGLAGDVAGIPQSVLERLAPEVGLRAIHSDPNHIELANWQQTAATQPPMTAWDQSNPANVPAQYAMNMEAGAPSYAFNLPANAPMGMGNNNPLNIKYFPGAPYAGLVGPSKNTDQGDPQMVFSSPEAGWSAGYSLLNRKYGSGMTTPNQIIAGKGGWTPGNTQAAANVAKAAGLGPNDDIGFSDPAKAQKFMRALVTQEQGGAGAAYPDAMIAGAVAGKPAAPSQAPGPIDPSIIARGGYSPPLPTIPGTTINSNPMASLGGKIGDIAGTLQKDLGKSDEAQKPPDIKADIPPAPPARNVSPLLGNPQIYAQRMSGLNQPMTWGGGPPGQMYGAGYGPQNQPVYGTSLMSQLQMLSDPAWMNQMAGG